MATIETYGRLKYIEPNDLIDEIGIHGPNGRKQWNQEDLNMSVDLQVVIPNRSDCMQIGPSVFYTQINDNTNSESFFSFLQGSNVKTNDGNKYMLTTSYLEASYAELSRTGVVNRESLGIESVDITFDQHFYPQVTIKFIDVRGYSLMMPTEEQFLGREELMRGKDTEHGRYSNFFRVLFNFPYPLFLLSVKGFYGTSITFMLAVNDFKNNFNSQTGNFEVTVSFIGYMYGLYTDLPMDMIIAAPYYGATRENIVTSDAWNGQHNFDNGNGVPGDSICTFIEFVDRCFNLKKATTDLMKGHEDESTLGQTIKNGEKIDYLNEVTASLKAVLEEIKAKNDFSGKDGIKVVQHDDYVLWFIKSDGSDINFKIDDATIQGLWDKFVSKWEGYSDTFDGDTIGVPEHLPDSLYDHDKKRWLRDLSDISTKDCKSFFVIENGEPKENEEGLKQLGGITFKELKETCPDMVNKINYLDDGYKTGKVNGFILMYILNCLANKRASFENDVLVKSPAVIEEMNSLYEQHLGFVPNILNIFRMIFAHIDCFMTEFNDMLKRIKDSNRQLSAFGKQINETDLKSDGFVPPFPAFYEERDGNLELIYPGDKEEFRPLMPEIEFVENLLNGVLGLKRKANQDLLKHKEIENYTQQTENNGTNGIFFPTNIGDFYTKYSPYKDVHFDSDGMTTLKNIVNIFTTRYVVAAAEMTILTDNMFGKAEAHNYLTIQKTPTEDIKALVEKYASCELSELVGVVKCELPGYLKIKDNQINVASGVPSFGLQFLKNSAIAAINGKIVTCFNETDKKEIFIYTDDSSMQSDIKRVVDMIKQGGQNDFYAPYERFFLHYPEHKGAARFNLSVGEWPSETGRSMLNMNLKFDSLAFDNSHYGSVHGNTFAGIDNNPSDLETCLKFLVCFVYNLYKPEDTSSCFLCCNDISFGGAYNFTKAAALLIGAQFKMYEATGDKDYINLDFFGNDFAIYSIEADDYYEYEKGLKSRFFIEIFDKFFKNEWPIILKQLVNKDNYESQYRPWRLKQPLKDAIMKYLVNKKDNPNDIAMYTVFTNTLSNEYEDGNPFADVTKTRYLGEYYFRELQAFFKEISDTYNGKNTITEELSGSDAALDSLTRGHKLALYKSLKNLYDKWMNSYRVEDFKLPTPQDDFNRRINRYMTDNLPNGENPCEFDNFLFVDAFQKDISYIMKINPRILSQMLSRCIEAEYNPSVYEFVHELLSQNHMLFQALPVYNNFYNEKSVRNMFTPLSKDIMKIGFGSTYVCMYIYEVSHGVTENPNSIDCIADDGFDLCGSIDDARPIKAENLFGRATDGTFNYTVPAFGVTYGRQSQAYFKNINVNMDNPKMTDYSIANLMSLASRRNNKALEDPNIIGNDIYNIYANRSYVCNVTMMGCANILPLMYFQLNNIPMFRGAYLISNVEHHIRAGQFDTTFSGVRINRNQIPYLDSNFTFFDHLDFGGLDAYNQGGMGPIAYECIGWDIEGALNAIANGCKSKDGTFSPMQNPKKGSCTYAVWAFVEAGFLSAIKKATSQDEKDKLEKERAAFMSQGGRYGVAVHQKGMLSNHGFKMIFEIPKGSNINDWKKYTKEKCLPGDIAVMHHGAAQTPSKGLEGHACMCYSSEENIWCSDFRQENVYVYGTKNELPIYIYRWDGCKAVSASLGAFSLDGIKDYTGPVDGDYGSKNYPKGGGSKKINANGSYTLPGTFGLYSSRSEMSGYNCCKTAITQLIKYIERDHIDTLQGMIMNWHMGLKGDWSKIREEKLKEGMIPDAYENRSFSGAQWVAMQESYQSEAAAYMHMSLGTRPTKSYTFLFGLATYISRRENGYNSEEVVKKVLQDMGIR